VQRGRTKGSRNLQKNARSRPCWRIRRRKAKQVPYAPSWTRKITSTTKYALGKILDEPGSSNSYGTPVAASGANAQTKTQTIRTRNQQGRKDFLRKNTKNGERLKVKPLQSFPTAIEEQDDQKLPKPRIGSWSCQGRPTMAEDHSRVEKPVNLPSSTPVSHLNTLPSQHPLRQNPPGNVIRRDSVRRILPRAPIQSEIGKLTPRRRQRMEAGYGSYYHHSAESTRKPLLPTGATAAHRKCWKATPSPA